MRRLFAVSALLCACCSPVERVHEVFSGAPSRTGLTPLEGGALLGNEAGKLLHLRDGKVAWEARLSREISARPVVAAGVVVAASVAGEWLGVDEHTGVQRWRVEDRPKAHAPLVANDTLVFGLTDGGEVLAIEAASGTLVWKRTLAAKPVSGPHPEPLFHQGSLLVGVRDVGLFALDAESGEVLWKHAVPKLVAFTTSSTRLFVLTSQGKVLAFAAGGPLWSRTLEPGVSGEPLVQDETVWVGLSNRALLALSVKDGAELGRLTLPAPLVGRLAAVDGQLAAATAGPEGRLYVLGAGKARAVEIRVDSPLRTGPLFDGELWWVAAGDGRVLSYRLR
ncbi:MAG: PQQ-binding-like beta-propeller repeat protein [Myxococcota bacterium]